MDGGGNASGALGRLANAFALDGAQVEQLATILGALADDDAPTSVTDLEQAVDVHLADSLSALSLDVVRMAESAVDIGSGAGFPGLVLAVALPRCKMTLLESRARKCRYLERVIELAEIDNARVACARVEQWPEGLERHDLATARALASAPVVLEYAAPLLRVGGSLVEWRGRRVAKEEATASQVAVELGMERAAIEWARPYPGSRDRHLHVYVKAHPTPPRFPRRVGMARKRPLGGG